MKFYEVKDPYYALISAKDEKTALKIYEEIVCDADDDTVICQINKYQVIKKLFKLKKIEKMTFLETVKYLLETRNNVVIIDGELL